MSQSTYNNKKCQKIFWALPAMGYGPNLLYWGKILKKYLKSYPNSIFFSTGERRQIPETSHYVENRIHHLPRIGFLKNRIIPLPDFLIALFREKPDLIVISEFGLVSLYICLIHIFLSKTKILLLVESDSTREGERYSNKIQKNIRKFICKKAKLIMTNNDKGYNYLTKMLNIPSDKIIKAVYLTSTPTTQNTNSISNYSQQKHKFNFLFIGRLVKDKGLHLLIDAVAQIDPKIKELLHITIAGEGIFKESLLKQINKHDLNNYFDLIGFVPYKKLNTLFLNADAFILPTLSDYRALVGFEAISYGLPLLLSKWDGAAHEIIDEGKNGFIINPMESNMLIEKITWFVNNRDKLQPFRKRSLQIAQHFTLDRATQNLIETCQQCIANED